MSKLILHHHRASPPSRACVMVVHELDLDVELREIDFDNNQHTSEAFTKLNPAQSVPTLIDGDFVICDSHAIALYLVEKYGKNDDLYPRNDVALRSVINDRLFFDASFLFPRGYNIMMPVFFNKESVVPDERIQQIHRGYRIVEKYLTSSKWIASNDRMTLADIAIFAWMEAYLQIFPTDECAHLKTWLNEMRKLPYYEEMKRGAKAQAEMFRGCLEANRKSDLLQSQ